MGFLDLIGVKVITVEDSSVPITEIRVHVNPFMGNSGTKALLNELCKLDALSGKGKKGSPA